VTTAVIDSLSTELGERGVGVADWSSRTAWGPNGWPFSWETVRTATWSAFSHKTTRRRTATASVQLKSPEGIGRRSTVGGSGHGRGNFGYGVDLVSRARQELVRVRFGEQAIAHVL
jgi:hypothetical protein